MPNKKRTKSREIMLLERGGWGMSFTFTDWLNYNLYVMDCLCICPFSLMQLTERLCLEQQIKLNLGTARHNQYPTM